MFAQLVAGVVILAVTACMVAVAIAVMPYVLWVFCFVAALGLVVALATGGLALALWLLERVTR